MFGLMKVFGGVLVLGRVAAADVAADETLPQMDPSVAHLEALLAAVVARFHFANFLHVWTGCLFVWHESSPNECCSGDVRETLHVSFVYLCGEGI
jgi:hypothetical protein